MQRWSSFCLRVCVSATAILSASWAAGQEYTFSIHHFLSPKALAQADFIEPWAKRVEAASNGRIKFEIFPAMSLGGKPPELYAQVRDGTADIVWTVPGYTPGTFPRVEVFELPTVHGGDALATNLAIQEVSDMLGPDLEDIYPILVHVHAGNALHIRDGDVAGAADFTDMRVRIPSRTGAWILEELGAEAVGMPVPDLPPALSKGNVDAALVPFEIAIPLGLADLTSASVQLHDEKRFGTATFLYAMNRKSYDSLPDDLKAVIDAHSGAALAKEAGIAWNNIEPVGIKRALDAGNSVTSLTAEATAEFQPAFEAVEERWVAEVKEAGIDGEGLLKAAKQAVANQSR